MTTFTRKDSAQALMQIAVNIRMAFPWATSPQGSLYWNEVYDSILLLARDAEKQGYGSAKEITFVAYHGLPGTAGSVNVATAPAVQIESKVHITHEGAACCGLKGRPWEWPAGHTQVLLKDKGVATCAACIAAAKKIPDKKVA